MLRHAPLLNTASFQTDQPIKICDERNVVQYINKAYETSTGKKRSKPVLKPRQHLPIRPS